MTTPTLRAIPCSERMPTREDANDRAGVLWIDASDGWAREVHYMYMPRDVTHWFPLNRSAIATEDAP